MQKQLFFLATALYTAKITFAGINPVNNMALAFTENKGQVHDQHYMPRPDVLFGAMTGGMAVHIKRSGVSYQLHRVDSWKEADGSVTSNSSAKQSNTASGTYREMIPGYSKLVPDQQTIHRIDLTWLKANNHFATTHDETLPSYNNYYLESCPNGALNVKSYTGITLHNLYNGINLHYYQKNGELKHDYIVAPHANYKQIQLKVEGADISVNNDGSLILNTPLGKVQEGAPIVYQNGKQLKAKWQINNNTLSFEIQNYNPNLELIIDPVTRLWGTYYGGADEDRGKPCATDATGNVYTAGYANSLTGAVLATSGAHQTTISGLGDAFLAKFNSAGSRLWGTYYGGSSGDNFNTCATDATGNVYAAGSTGSSSGISSLGHQMSNNGAADAFLVKFNSNGVRQWATYYGGGSADGAFGCNTDTGGNVYMCGSTSGATGTTIATSGAHQTVYGGGTTDAFLVKFNSNGVRQWGTYYGGPNGSDNAVSCFVDGLGNSYVTGLCGSATGTIIATATSHQPLYGGGTYDGFLAKFDANGVRQWATWYGGTANDSGWWCQVDANGDICFAGSTASTNTANIATPGCHQGSFGGGGVDAVLAKFTSNGVRLWGTYYGGTGDDGTSSVACDPAGNIYLAGTTSSSLGTIMATAGSHQPNYGGGAYDGFLAKFDASGIRQWGTYYGGAGEDWAYSCTADSYGSVYMAGYTDSNTGTAIATLGSNQSAYGGGADDAYLVRFDVCDVAPLQPAAISGPIVCCSGVPATYSVVAVSGANSYTWSLPSGWSGSSNSNVISAISGASGNILLVSGNSCGASPQQTLNVTVNPSPTVSVNSGSICLGNTFTIAPTGANTYTIQGGNMIVTPLSTTNYTVAGTSTAGCLSSNTAVATVTVNPLPNVSASSNNSAICVGETATLTASGASTYTFNPGGVAASITVSPTSSTSYQVSGTDANGCKNTASLTLSVDACVGIINHTNVTVSGVEAYPNPTSGLLNIQLSSDSEILIFNAIGQQVYSAKLQEGLNQVDLGGIAKGVYMIRLVNSGNLQGIRFVKE